MSEFRENCHGCIGYFASDGERTGTELFSVSREADGGSILRAQCMMDDDALVRDCLLCLDRADQPREAFVRTIEGGELRGSGWYRFETSRIDAVFAGPDGAFETIAREETCRFFGTHSLVNDGWIARALRGAQRAELTGHANSLAANGGGTPGLHTTRAVVEEHGARPIDVTAGTFDCRFITVTYGEYPPIEMWLTGPHDVLAFMRWDYLDGYYELLSLTES
jgi:hypothetical protein